MRTILISVLLLAAFVTQAPSPFSAVTETVAQGGRQLKGQVTLAADGQEVAKRFVLRTPPAAVASAGRDPAWNGSLVIGAHGGSGGSNFDRQGHVIGTDETALDDVIGAYALAKGFAYASVDRDGAAATPAGLSLTTQFTAIVRDEIARRLGAAPRRTYVVGLSMGGGIARMAAEMRPAPYDGALIIAGAGGDLVTRLDRQTRAAALWPLIDPRAHYGIPPNDPKLAAYAEAVGTPVIARRLWPYTGASSVAAAARPAGTAENSSADPSIPTIEVVGTWDDLVIREVRAYRERVVNKDRHRLYQVEGVWHMSGDDDGVMSFQYIAESRMKLGKDVADAMGEGPSYLPTVREAFDLLVRWVEKGAPPPPSQTVKPGEKLR